MTNIEDVLLDDSIVTDHLNNDKLTQAAEYLFQKQLLERPDLKKNYNDLSKVLKKELIINDFRIEINYNPARIISTTAKTDKLTISKRDCFLCPQNLPPQQKGILYRNYILLVNPFPIFPEHFTIAHSQHIPQLIEDSFEDLLIISKNLSSFLTLFYNGPECGASAPDHLHFQGGTTGYLPVENELPFLKQEFGEILLNKSCTITAVDDGLRKIITITGSESNMLVKYFNIFLKIYAKYSTGSKEPMLNIISKYTGEKWEIIIFLREKHRPDVYFEKGEDNFLVSPAAADIGGICITPLLKDYDSATPQLIAGILREVSLSSEKFKDLKEELKFSL